MKISTIGQVDKNQDWAIEGREKFGDLEERERERELYFDAG
jgi:hypothetical protein